MPIYTLTLVAKETIAQNTLELQFEKPEGFQYVAGQYGGFTLLNPTETDAKGNTRRFSLVSAPHESTLKIVTRIQQSSFKRELNNLEPGHTLKFAGPTGNFVLPPEHQNPIILIAGGIGIAPFYSMIKETLLHEPTRDIILFYGNQTVQDTAYREALEALAKKHASFKFVLTLANPGAEWSGNVGYITDELIIKNTPDYANQLYYVCGSPAMVQAMQQVLADIDIPPEHIKVEDFPGY